MTTFPLIVQTVQHKFHDASRWMLPRKTVSLTSMDCQQYCKWTCLGNSIHVYIYKKKKKKKDTVNANYKYKPNLLWKTSLKKLTYIYICIYIFLQLSQSSLHRIHNPLLSTWGGTFRNKYFKINSHCGGHRIRKCNFVSQRLSYSLQNVRSQICKHTHIHTHVTN
jgi:hypothetical protein